MRSSLLFVILFFACISSFSQVGGKYVYSFLNLPQSPRQSALGGKAITLYDYDVSSVLLNPASLNTQMHNQLSLNYNSYLADVNYGSVAYAVQLDRWGQMLHIGVSYIDYGSFDGYDDLGNPTESFSGSDVVASVGYSYRLPRSNIYIGGNAKFISSKLEQYNSFGAAIDLGAIYKSPKSSLRIAVAARNIGTQFKAYHETYESLPFDLLLGVSYELENLPLRWHFTMDNLQKWRIGVPNPNRAEVGLDGKEKQESVTFLDHAMRHMLLGIELFPERILNLRLGYNFRRGEELRIDGQRAFAGLNAGFSIKLNSLRLSYAYSRYSAAASSNFFGLNIEL